MGTARPTIDLDDDRVRVTTWAFGADGDDTGHHVHEYDYVVVPVTGGSFRATDTDGASKDLTQDAGSPYLGAAGTAHNVAVIGDVPAVFVEIELKR